MGLVGGTPTYTPLEGFAASDVPARTYHYSPDGRLFAYTLPSVFVLPCDRVIRADFIQPFQCADLSC
jgi:hypothetical protein